MSTSIGAVLAHGIPEDPDNRTVAFPLWWVKCVDYAAATWKDCHLPADAKAALVYYNALRGLGEVTVLNALFRLSKTSERMPTAAAWRAAANGILDEQNRSAATERARITTTAPPNSAALGVADYIAERLAAIDDLCAAPGVPADFREQERRAAILRYIDLYGPRLVPEALRQEVGR